MAAKGQAGAAAADPDPTGVEALTGGAGSGRGEGGRGAGSPTPKKTDPPSLVTVLLGGKSYQVPPDVAESIAAEQESFHRERGRLSGELTQLKTRPPEKTTTREPESPRRPAARLAVDDIDEWDRQMAAYEAHRELQIEQRLEERFQKQTTERDKATRERTELDGFIGRLGKAHPALDGEEQVIFTAMGRLAKKYPNDPLPFSDPRTLKLVAEEATSELTRLAEKGKSLAPKVPTIEGQGGRGGVPAGTRTEEGEGEKGPTSIADIQRARRLRRLGRGRGGLGREED